MGARYDLIIRNGTIVNHVGRGPGDVGVRNGRIAAIGDLSQASAGETIDAQGLHVLPGLIDSQVHFREPGKTHKEDLESGARAAALGGVTAVFEMPNTDPGTVTPDLLNDKLARAKGRMHVDHAFYAGGANDNAEALPEMERMTGCCGIKVFMGASTGNLLVRDDEHVEAILRFATRRVTFHSEDDFRLEERKPLAREGDWTSHYEVRDAESAIRSTVRLLSIAKRLGKRIHVLHVTTAEEMELLAAAKDFATVEILPQHLTLEAPECYERLQGFAQMNPPIREARHKAALWELGIRQGVCDVIGSDHAPHTREEKARPYPASPSGMPGVQTIVPLMLTHVAEGRLTLERLIDLMAHGPQRVFGIAGKGRLALGYDADFTIVDLAARRVFRDEDQATKCGWTPFHGMEAKGWPVMTIVRGQTVMRDGDLVTRGAGQPVRFTETLSAG